MLKYVTLAFLIVAGCYSPKVKNRGFACDPTKANPCPAGFTCVNGFCDDGSGGNGGSGGSGGGDLAMSTSDLGPSGDLATHGGGDLAGSGDLSSPADLAPAPSDMTCLPFGHDCQGNATCCSYCCAGGCNIYGSCAAF